MTIRLCEFPGCGRQHSGHGLCASHLKQQRLGKPLTPIAPNTRYDSRVCAAEGCDRPRRALGLCDRHYRQQAAGKPLTPLMEPRVGCTVPGCLRPHAAHGLCSLHAKRVARTGSPYLAERTPAPRKPRKPRKPRRPKMPKGWGGPAAKNLEQAPPVQAGVRPVLDLRDLTYPEMRDAVAILHAHDALDLLDMVMPDGWRRRVAEHRREAA